MNKATIFFSHSSKDKDAIAPIRQRILEGMGSSIEIFMSSDGASIPFGRNWLKEIEDALKNCKIMFVWMTPSSLTSSWIPFEAGHAYARGMKVVPIGFLGTTIDSLAAPLNLLQGFNVSSSNSLNNIISIINNEFSLSFPDLFTADFYSKIVERKSPEYNPDILKYIKILKCSFSTITIEDNESHPVKSNWLQILKNILGDLEIPFTEEQEKIFGVGFNIYAIHGDHLQLKVQIDPLALNTTWRVWTRALQEIYDAELPYTFITPEFRDEFELPDDASMIGARLLNSDVSFDTQIPHVIYRYRNIEFRVILQRKGSVLEKSLVLLVPRDNEYPIPLYSLMELFEKRRIFQ